MMQAPAALPLHLMLSMLQSQAGWGSLPSGLGGWNAPFGSFPLSFQNPGTQWMNAFLPEFLRPKSPLERSVQAGLDTWQNLSQQFSDESIKWLAPLNVNQPKKRNSRQPRAGGEPAQNNSRAADAAHWIPASAGMANSMFTDYLPHFMQPEFLTALGEQSVANSAGFAAGMQAYLTSDYQRPEPEYDVLWSRAEAKLYDLAPEATDALAIVMVPSLINKSYVLDLYPEASLAQFLKKQGYRPLLLDWGEPSGEALEFRTEDYITAYALPALQALREAHDGPIALLGYCMGGVFTVAMAQLAPLFVDALILLATPWDFAAADTPSVLLNPATQLLMRNWIAAQNPVPSLVTQTMFHLIDPWRIQQKYSRFPDLSEAEKTHFLAVEQWVNDGVPLAAPLAEECLVDWPQKNILATHQWKIGRRWIEPEAIQCPTLCVMPTKDKIVPLGMAEPLAAAIPRCDVLKPESGHIGMVVGRNAKANLWKPLAYWLKERF